LIHHAHWNMHTHTQAGINLFLGSSRLTLHAARTWMKDNTDWQVHLIVIASGSHSRRSRMWRFFYFCSRTNPRPSIPTQKQLCFFFLSFLVGSCFDFDGIRDCQLELF
jgi:hypothetical protein